VDDLKRIRQPLPSDLSLERGMTAESRATASQTLTLEIEGVIPLEVFARGAQEWVALVNQLSKDINRKEKVAWYVDELSRSSMIVTARGEAESSDNVVRVVRAYENVAHALHSHGPIPYSRLVRKHAGALVDVLKLSDKITAIRFRTDDETVDIYGQAGASGKSDLLRSYGAIEGRIQTLSDRTSLSFTLYDALFDKAVTCYLRPGQDAEAAALWRRRAIVRGLISRDPVNGRPVAIHDIDAILPLEGGEGNPLSARGVLPWREGDEPLTSILDRLRDEW
jgi:hypothetical protein